jgi:hypothetical protein
LLSLATAGQTEVIAGLELAAPTAPTTSTSATTSQVTVPGPTEPPPVAPPQLTAYWSFVRCPAITWSIDVAADAATSSPQAVDVVSALNVLSCTLTQPGTPRPPTPTRGLPPIHRRFSAYHNLLAGITNDFESLLLAPCPQTVHIIMRESGRLELSPFLVQVEGEFSGMILAL